MTARKCAVCVPVRNEEACLPKLLASLANLDANSIDLTLCLLFDGCTDDSEALVDRHRTVLPFPVITHSTPLTTTPSAGRARRAALQIGQGVVKDARDAMLLTTDADSCPREDWLQASIRALTIAEVAAGRIIRLNGEHDELQSRVEAYFDRLHSCRRLIDPVPWDLVPGCHFGGGANLAMRAEAYAAIGGFRALPSGEDARFLDDASREGFRVRRDPAMVVFTSSRRVGRADGGLAAALTALAERGPPMVTSPSVSIWQYERQAHARRVFANLRDADLRDSFGRSIGLTGDHVLGVGRDCPNAEAFAMRVVPSPTDSGVLIPLSEAENTLVNLERAWMRGAA